MKTRSNDGHRTLVAITPTMTERPSTTAKTNENSTANSSPQVHADRKNMPLNDWNAIRQSWLQPNNINNLPSSSTNQTTITTSTSDNGQKRTVKRLAKIDQMLADYDKASRLGHPNPKPMLSVIDFADRLTNQAQGHPGPIPLSQAVSMLYRSWFHDGTIPDSFPFHLEKMKDANDTEQEQQE
ncbi:hypothetical protein PtA15_5A559 [Puccinia triticina]|uniref:DUF4050 domain-containing protein n=1 Tax=Puccinia triticina TaxID=208348 RepID=A0ABY7CLH1_9BASI|nr:uncharacterized protein PtA15_5A559 [Puccinia triticina]WAQ84986.1 hypothetical protein PtA15_5A559 [Puccinia triticina]